MPMIVEFFLIRNISPLVCFGVFGLFVGVCILKMRETKGCVL